MATSALAIIITAKDEASHVLNGVGKESEGLGSKLKSLAPVLAGVAAGFVSFKTAESAIDFTSELGGEVEKLRRETGLTAEDSSRLLFAFKHVGLDAADASKSIGIFAKQLKLMSDSTDENGQSMKPIAGILKGIGVTALDSAGNIRPVNEIIPELADKFKAMPDGLEKTALAMQLFGKSGKDMLPLLNQGSAGLTDLGKEADKLGVTLTGDNLEQIKQYKFAQRDLGEAIGGLKLQIGLALMPQLTKMAAWFTENQPTIRAFLHEAIEKATEVIGGLKDAVTTVAPTFESAFKTIATGFEVIKPGLQWVLDNKIALTAAFVAIGVAAILAFTPITLPILAVGAALVGLMFVVGLVAEHWDEIKAKTIEVWSAISSFMDDKLGFVKDLVTFAFEDIKAQVTLAFNVVRDIFTIAMAVIHGDWGAAWEGIKQLVSDVWDGIRTMIELRIGLVRNLIGDAWDIIKMGAALAWNGIKDLISGAWDGIVAGGEAAAASIKGIINGIIRAVNSVHWDEIVMPGAIPNIPGFGGLNIPQLVAGTQSFRGGLAVVGERGPELVNLPGGSRVFSNS